MATLHILNKAPAHSRTRRCLAQLQNGDSLVLLENGAYAMSLVAGAATGCELFALQADVDARGLSQQRPDTMQLVDYPGLVALTVSHDRVINW